MTRHRHRRDRQHRPAPPRPPAFPKYGGTRLHLGAYHLHLSDLHKQLRDTACWKLERAQHLREPRKPSWQAFHTGDWHKALHLAAEEATTAAPAIAAEEARHAPLRHLKIIEEPLTPYQQWALHVLNEQAHHGRHIRVLPATAPAVRTTENETGPLPEVVTLGDQAVYHVHHTTDATPDGATAYTDPALTHTWPAHIAHLYQQGEPLNTYFHRAVKNLPPPQPQ